MKRLNTILIFYQIRFLDLNSQKYTDEYVCQLPEDQLMNNNIIQKYILK